MARAQVGWTELSIAPGTAIPPGPCSVPALTPGPLPLQFPLLAGAAVPTIGFGYQEHLPLTEARLSTSSAKHCDRIQPLAFLSLDGHRHPPRLPEDVTPGTDAHQEGSAL